MPAHIISIPEKKLNIIVITGGCFGSEGKKMVTGSWAWAWWLVTDVQKMSLEVMTLNPMCDNVETKQGVPLTVTGVAQVDMYSSFQLIKIMNSVN